jgi:hypothetical protein
LTITLPYDLKGTVPFELFGSNGALVHQGALYFNHTNQASIILPAHIISGIYILSVVIDGQLQKSTFLKF